MGSETKLKGIEIRRFDHVPEDEHPANLVTLALLVLSGCFLAVSVGFVDSDLVKASWVGIALLVIMVDKDLSDLYRFTVTAIVALAFIANEYGTDAWVP